MTAVFLQSWTSDPLDKLIVFTIIYLVIRALPQRTLRTFAPAGKDGSTPADHTAAADKAA